MHQTKRKYVIYTLNQKLVDIIVEYCESCGQEFEPIRNAKTLEENFAADEMNKLGICQDCFNKRFKISTKKRSGYGGRIYELDEKSMPRFGAQKLSCLKCNWIAWTDEGLAAHMRKRHP